MPRGGEVGAEINCKSEGNAFTYRDTWQKMSLDEKVAFVWGWDMLPQ